MMYEYLKIKNLVHDKELEKIKVFENNEPLMLLKEKSYLKIRNKSSIALNLPINQTYLRKKVVEKLKEAKKTLPIGYSFFLVDGYRSIRYQYERFLIQFAKMYNKNPNLCFEEIYWKTSKWTAPVFGIKPPHTTGGAVDITLLKEGKEVDMGTKLNEFNYKTKTLSKNISISQKNNRKLLINAMSKAGFINYPTEWWHWSYGDQYWSAIKKKPSIYDVIEHEI